MPVACRRTKANSGSAEDLLKSCLGSSDHLMLLFDCQVPEAFMHVSVMCDLMAVIHDCLAFTWPLLNNPPRDEERGRQPKLSQDFKYPGKRPEGPIPAKAKSFRR